MPDSVLNGRFVPGHHELFMNALVALLDIWRRYLEKFTRPIEVIPTIAVRMPAMAGLCLAGPLVRGAARGRTWATFVLCGVANSNS